MAGEFKKTSGGFLMWVYVISLGQKLGSQAYNESDAKDLYGAMRDFFPLFQGGNYALLSTLPMQKLIRCQAEPHAKALPRW